MAIFCEAPILVPYKKDMLFSSINLWKIVLQIDGGRKINCVMRRFFPSSSVGDRPAPRGCTSTPDERKVTTI